LRALGSAIPELPGLVRALAFAGLVVCSGCPSDDEECPDGSPKKTVAAVAEGCEDMFDCGPQVDLAFATGADDFAHIEADSQQDVYYGPQGGYHFFVAAEMHNFCPVVFLNFSVDILREDGSRETLQEIERHVQSVRCSQQGYLFAQGCDGEATQQRWWALTLQLPCDYYPDDPEQPELNCEEPPLEHIEDLDVILRVEVRDHSGQADPAQAREAAAEVQIDPVCCAR
jgi:hypothetical protein